jgi:hypothetical protein
MRRPVLARPALLAGLYLTLLAAGCGDNAAPAPAPDGGIDGPPVQAVGPCVDQPTDLALPPGGALPCGLLPPGFVTK